MEKITKEEKKVAWKVLDALQNVIPSNQSLPIKKVFERFDLIQELKDQIDVRETEEKLSTKSILPYAQGKKEVKCEDMQQFKNRLCSIFSFDNKHLDTQIKKYL